MKITKKLDELTARVLARLRRDLDARVAQAERLKEAAQAECQDGVLAALRHLGLEAPMFESLDVNGESASWDDGKPEITPLTKPKE